MIKQVGTEISTFVLFRYCCFYLFECKFSFTEIGNLSLLSDFFFGQQSCTFYISLILYKLNLFHSSLAIQIGSVNILFSNPLLNFLV